MQRTLFDTTHDQYRVSVRQFLAREVVFTHPDEFDAFRVVGLSKLKYCRCIAVRIWTFERKKHNYSGLLAADEPLLCAV